MRTGNSTLGTLTIESVKRGQVWGLVFTMNCIYIQTYTYTYIYIYIYKQVYTKLLANAHNSLEYINTEHTPSRQRLEDFLLGSGARL